MLYGLTYGAKKAKAVSVKILCGSFNLPIDLNSVVYRPHNYQPSEKLVISKN